MATRVRVSVLKFTVEVMPNGSPLNVTDSSAIARVEAESLIKMGAFGFAAAAVVTAPQTAVRRTRLKTRKKLLGE
jgi:hypothetical protein